MHRQNTTNSIINIGRAISRILYCSSPLYSSNDVINTYIKLLIVRVQFCRAFSTFKLELTGQLSTVVLF